jgi:RING finger protein 121
MDGGNVNWEILVVYASVQYYTTEGLPRKVLATDVCAVCGNHLHESPAANATDDGGDGDSSSEATYKLSCQHVFHEFCIRGWCIVGKQQTCPYCKEKVDLKRMFKNP